MRYYDAAAILKAAEDSDEWSFTGTASTPQPDRDGDVIEPGGVKYALPVPLLWQHDRDLPVGQIETATITPAGIQVAGHITRPQDGMPDSLSERLKTAWASIKSGLVRGLSVGFIPKDYDVRPEGGMHFRSWDWLELSLVTVPANPGAHVQTVKTISFVNPYALANGAFKLRR